MKSRLFNLAVLLSLVVLNPCWAQVALDATAEGEVDPSTSLTIPLTVSGANRALYAPCVHSPGGDDVTALTATFNGVPMTPIITDTTTHSNRHVVVFRLIAPATGTNNAVFDWGGTNRSFACALASFTGVNQTTPEDAYVLTDGGGGVSSISRSVASATGDMIMDVVVLPNGILNLVVNNGNTQLQQRSGGAGGLNSMGTSYEAGAATETLGWTWDTATVAAVQWAWNINAASAGTPELTTRRRGQ